ncbi:MAG: methyltransferase domain-containing protein [Spirochaetales bacterium]|nr:methyltransferase domain-containing protein [Spirochaetales bacterium]
MKTYSSAAAFERERRITIVCPICGGAAVRPHFSVPGGSFVRCAGCGLVYQNPQPVFDDLKGRYAQAYCDYEIENEDNFFELMRLGLRDIGFDESFFTNVPGKTFLDVGCATGKLLDVMQHLGFRVQGVEICAESARYGMAKRRIPVFIGPLEEAGFPDGSFSFVHFSHLIEHVPDPYSFLREVKRVLAPNGYAIITTPNIAGLQARLFRSLWRSAIPDHLFLFSKRTLPRLLERAGLEVLRLVTWGGLAVGTAPAWIKNRIDAAAKRMGFGDVMLVLATARGKTGVTAPVMDGGGRFEATG